ncbi:FAD-dependent monooxygenase [Ottowia thiooxydans]|uniref:FAD-dependent monooxygenase n=1 Tax=Ottowia thiooxydans TaxID=219182 RepID=UPI0003FB26FC|nr:FAD-dependent monooxygenase [Ottowia thiooxydans]
MKAAKDKPVIVAGGGLGGLSVALALGQAGHCVQVLEQAPEIAPIGYGIQLGPNVLKAFSQLGLASIVKAACDYPQSLVMPDAESGDVLLRIPLNGEAYIQRFGEPYIVIHRSAIHDILLEACSRQEGVELIVNSQVDNFRDEGEDGVSVTTTDGRRFEGSALIGADGVKSRIRALIQGETAPRDTGYVAHRTVMPMSQTPAGLPHLQDVVLWSGPGYHVVHYPLNQGTVFNAVAVFRNPAPGVEDPKQYVAQVQQVYGAAHPSLKKVIELMDLQKRWPLADRDPFRTWSCGRVTLLGDAVHPTLQSYGQGAGMAVEDAVCLAGLVNDSGGDFEKAFAEYPKRRLVRSARIQLGSRHLWEFYHAEGIAREVRNAELKERTDQSFYDCLSWIWDGDPMSGMPLTVQKSDGRSAEALA